MVRITGGRLKGRQIVTAKGPHTRPTLAKTRKAIFDSLHCRYDLSRFEACDLFAGSGALGFEAYSRGVERVCFVEHNRRAISLIRRNIVRLKLPATLHLVCEDAVHWLQSRSWQGRPILFLVDPPYKTDWIAKVVESLEEQSHCLVGSLLVVETDRNHCIEYPTYFALFKQKNFGRTRLDFVEILPRQ